jgi:hypothetical protein
MTRLSPLPNRLTALLAEVRVLHTLGPTGTNCEEAAHFWFNGRPQRGDIKLYATLETALEAMPQAPGHALLACAVYPHLHTLVFSNLHRLAMADTFVMPTFEMVLASRTGGPPRVVATHPAPQGLVPADMQRVLVNSNAQAAIECAEGRTDGCITTSKAAAAHKLQIVTNHGAVPMVFTLHVPTALAR